MSVTAAIKLIRYVRGWICLKKSKDHADLPLVMPLCFPNHRKTRDELA